MLPEPDTYEDEEVDGIIYISMLSGVSISRIQDAFKNAAIDSSLALDIFRVLLGMSSSMHMLEIHPRG